jgi:hypothetical protein
MLALELSGRMQYVSSGWYSGEIINNRRCCLAFYRKQCLQLGLEIHVVDITLEQFKMSSSRSLPSHTCRFAIILMLVYLDELSEERVQRILLEREERCCEKRRKGSCTVRNTSDFKPSKFLKKRCNSKNGGLPGLHCGFCGLE